jgi:hypothetical protein
VANEGYGNTNPSAGLWRLRWNKAQIIRGIELQQLKRSTRRITSIGFGRISSDGVDPVTRIGFGRVSRVRVDSMKHDRVDQFRHIG